MAKNLSKMSLEDLQAEYERLHDERRELELEQMEIGTEINQRNVIVGAKQLYDSMDDATLAAIAQIAAQHLGSDPNKAESRGQ